MNDRAERFREMYEATHVQVFAYAYRRTKSREDAEDAFGQTYAIAWRKLDSISPNYEALWLFKTCRYVIANQRRAVTRRSNLVNQLGIELVATGTTALDEFGSIAASEALRKLSDEDREVLMLAAWEGLSSREIAHVLGCSPVTARVKLHRARRSLVLKMSAAGLIPPKDNLSERTLTPAHLLKKD